MKLKTIFNEKQEIRPNDINGVTESDLMFKFSGLAGRLNLRIEADENGVMYASDGSGEMSFERKPESVCFRWKAFDFKSDAKKIFELQ